MIGVERTAVIIGATGLIGGLILNLLLANSSYTKVTAITRSPLSKKHPKLNNVLVDFEYLNTIKAEIVGHDAFCCLGTTIKTAGTRSLFRRVDFDYANNFAELCRANGTQHFLLISAIGANPNSSIFYSRVKGELEKALGLLAFPILSIFRPSLLLGDRKESRLGEELAIRFSALLGLLTIGPLKQYHPVKAEMLAKAMVNCALDAPEPHGQSERHYAYKQIMRLAKA